MIVIYIYSTFSTKISEMHHFYIKQTIFSLLLTSFFFISLNPPHFCYATNNITQGQSIKDGETLISSGHIFELGFFSIANSSLRYVGIWYNISTQPVVWVANRDSPIADTNGVLQIGDDGNLVILDGVNGSSVWSSNASTVSTNTTAVLTDTGNFILSSSRFGGDANNAYWQSFDYPTDTYLPGMKVRLRSPSIWGSFGPFCLICDSADFTAVLVNNALGENRAFKSWKSNTDLSTGNYSMGIDPRGSPQIIIWDLSNSVSNRRWRSGQWNGLSFVGVPNMTSNYLYGFKLSTDDGNGNMYFTYTPLNISHVLKFRITFDGYEEQLKWNEVEKDWTVMQYQPDDECEFYNKCGNFSICNVKNSPICNCIDGFDPKDSNQWSLGNWENGCVRRTKLQCQRNSSDSQNAKEDGFLEMADVKLPDFSDSVSAVNQGDCENQCLMNCSCKGYAYVSGIGCMIWMEDLVDVKEFSEDGKSLFVRLAGSELGSTSSRISNIVIAAIVVPVTIAVIIFIWLLWIFRARLKACSKSRRTDSETLIYDMNKSKEFSKDFSGPNDVAGEGNSGNGPELPIFSFQCVSDATNKFSNENKLGQGGFGPVYKGIFPGGQQIAVKRLSRRSGQGVEEFKNEMKLIAKLQHRNLVRLIGCCVEGEEKMLIYEYMPNKSLDRFLFDPEKQAQLDWGKRFAIIEGIARGLVYLHRDSRLRIIHRDLKASNILLDEDMNPKISDFGLARIFGGNQNEEANTNRVVGTYGYMSPEYAMEGLFSVKSDVYSFGVLLLEIISGRRNTSFRLAENSSLIKHAWNLWNEGKATEIIDTAIMGSCSKNQVFRCIQLGMLCVQDLATFRPTMPTVVLMLESESATLPTPKLPSITSMRYSVDVNDFDEGPDIVSSNDMTVSVVSGR